MKNKTITQEVLESLESRISSAPTQEEVQEAMASMQDNSGHLFTEKDIDKINKEQPKPEFPGSMVIEADLIKADPKEEKKKSEPKQATQAMIAIGHAGALEYTNHTELSAAARFAIAAKIAPDALRKEGPEAVAAAMIFCKQHSLPLSAMSKLAYIRGRITVFGTLYLALAQKHKDFGEMQVFFLTEKQERICMDNKNLNEDVWACVIKAKKKKDSDWTEFFFTKDEAKKAGLFKNDIYNKYLKDMLYHRAKQRMVDAFYASALEGVEYYEALMEYEPEKEVGRTLSEKLGLNKPQEEVVL